MFGGEIKVTSDFIASSVCVNPVIVRCILGQLKESGIIDIARGIGGARIIKDYENISLLDIFKATDSVSDGLFGFHENPNNKCPVGKNVHSVLDGYLNNAQSAFESNLSQTSFKEIAEKLNGLV